jgi:DNA-binding CsgD family transcriptional regulator
MAAIMHVTEEWLDYCKNQKEFEVIKERLKHSSNNQTAKALGIPRQTIDAIVKRVYKRLQQDTGDYLFIKGISTLYGKDGDIKLQWVKTEVEKEEQFEAFKEAVEEIINA